jgi:hypothetical protein
MNQNMTLDRGVDDRHPDNPHPDPSDEFPPPPESRPPEWISADGVSWEHRDGHVAHPRSTGAAVTTGGAVCLTPAGTSDRSGS